MTTFAFAWPSAAATGRRDKIETREMEGEERRWARTAEPTRPVAPVRITWTMVSVVSRGFLFEVKGRDVRVSLVPSV